VWRGNWAPVSCSAAHLHSFWFIVCSREHPFSSLFGSCHSWYVGFCHHVVITFAFWYLSVKLTSLHSMKLHSFLIGYHCCLTYDKSILIRLIVWGLCNVIWLHSVVVDSPWFNIGFFDTCPWSFVYWSHYLVACESCMGTDTDLWIHYHVLSSRLKRVFWLGGSLCCLVSVEGWVIFWYVRSRRTSSMDAHLTVAVVALALAAHSFSVHAFIVCSSPGYKVVSRWKKSSSIYWSTNCLCFRFNHVLWSWQQLAEEMQSSIFIDCTTDTQSTITLFSVCNSDWLWKLRSNTCTTRLLDPRRWLGEQILLSLGNIRVVAQTKWRHTCWFHHATKRKQNTKTEIP